MTSAESQKLLSTPRGRKKLNLYYVVHDAEFVTNEQRMAAAEDLVAMMIEDIKD